jgi:GDPmannose 4,6-dehydratase
LDQMTLLDAITTSDPDELYNLAATSFVPVSWRQPVMTAQFTAVGVTSMLEAVRITNPGLRVYQASTSEMFGATTESPQHEATPFVPHNPYAVAKLYGHLMVSTYRERYGMHASSGILYNHESPRRPLEFVTRKVANAAAAVSLGLETHVSLGSLDARRDWGYAGDYVRAMWLMVQQDEPDDFVIASGVTHSVGELAACAFARVGLDWEAHVRVDDSLVRGKAELHDLVGDASRARERLGWSPTLDFEGLVHHLVDSDLSRLRAGLELAESLAADR